MSRLRLLVATAGTLAASTAFAGDAFTIRSVVRDFSPSHPDFSGAGVTDSHVAGMMGPTLSSSGRPEATLTGTEISQPWTDANGNPVMGPFGNSNLGSALEVTKFDISDGEVTVNEDFAVNVKILGSAI